MFAEEELIPRLRELYLEIDATYASTGEQVGFSCEGCDGVKCCTVDVSLHTFVEMLFLRQGFNSLDTGRQLEVLGRCRAMIKAREDDPLGVYRNAVCALNFDGLCSLYEYRPMICRLAGIPHFIARPDGKIIESGGCSRYCLEILAVHPGVKIDRSPFYRGMAELEIEVVRHRGRRTPSRTVSQTLGLEDEEDMFPE